jgi:tripartite-type tricarboxylate transporter receptor subunit TctC
MEKEQTMKSTRKSLVAAGVIAMGLALGATQATASDTYPSKPVHLIVPVAPGGGTDFTARLLAEEMGKRLGESVVVENRPGGAGNIGVTTVVRAKPDGHTLVMPITSFPVNATLYTNLPFDTRKDLAPVALAASLPLVLVVNPNVPANSVAQLVELARQKPGSLNFANSGVGTTAHLAGELFKKAAGVDMVSIAYKGGGPAVTDLMGGHVQLYFSTPSAVLSHIEAGKLRALAVTSGTRLAELPDVPTLAESGMPDMEVKAWFGLFAPAGTPKAIVDRLNAVANDALQDENVRKQMAAHGFQPEGRMSPDELQRFLDTEIDKWGAVIKELGLTATL